MEKFKLLLFGSNFSFSFFLTETKAQHSMSAYCFVLCCDDDTIIFCDYIMKFESGKKY